MKKKKKEQLYGKDGGGGRHGQNNVNGQPSALAAPLYATLCIRARAIHSFAYMSVTSSGVSCRLMYSARGIQMGGEKIESALLD